MSRGTCQHHIRHTYPRASSALTMSVRPAETATCRGVHPASSCVLTRAPLERRKRAASWRPPEAAQCSAVRLSCSVHCAEGGEGVRSRCDRAGRCCEFANLVNAVDRLGVLLTQLPQLVLLPFVRELTHACLRHSRLDPPRSDSTHKRLYVILPVQPLQKRGARHLCRRL
jgi:hypothetical protein